jgi:hypothetical protein
MNTLQFESVKVALKQDKTGYMLTLSIHPDEIPEDLMRDFVGARYQVVMVRLNGEEKPMNREQEHAPDLVRSAALLCRNPKFWHFLSQTGQTFDESEEVATTWLKQELQIASRAELKTNQEAARRMKFILKEFYEWTQVNG